MARMLQALKNLEARAPQATARAAASSTERPPAAAAVPPEPAASESRLEAEKLSATLARLEQLATALQLPEVGGGPTGQPKSPQFDLATLAAAPRKLVQEPGAGNQESAERGQEPKAKSEELGVKGQEPGASSQSTEDREQDTGRVSSKQATESFPLRPRTEGSRSQSLLERSICSALENPAEARALMQMAERLGRDVAQSGSKSLVLVGIGPESTAHETLLCAGLLLAEQTGEVLVIDANLARRPISEGLQAGQERGLAELLRGNETPRELCRPTAWSRLSLLPAGQLRHADLSAAGTRLEEIIQQVSAGFSLVLIDGGRWADLAATTLARLCDATYFVVQLGTVEANEAQAALRDFRAAGARVLGCIAT